MGRGGLTPARPLRRRDWIAGALAGALLPRGAAMAQPAAAAPPALTLAPGERLADVLARARDGDTVGVLPGVHRGQAAVITHKRLTLRGLGPRPLFEAAGAHAEGKALLVVRGGEVVVENLAFRGVRVADGNGAGVRFERGRLTLRRCAFADNQMGVLTSNAGEAELAVEDCEFAQAPREPGPLHHLLYVGRIARLSVLGSRFHDGWQGHLLKSRARENWIAANLLFDGEGGEASYELEFPNGGVAWVVGNVIGQSAATRNLGLLSYGAEGSMHVDNGLYAAHNTFVNEGLKPGLFVRVHHDRLPPGLALPVRLVNNLFVGPGVVNTGLADWASGNWPLPLAALDAPQARQFGLPAGSWLRGRGIAPGQAHGRSLAPTEEFVLPVGRRTLAAPAQWTPGAFQ